MKPAKLHRRWQRRQRRLQGELRGLVHRCRASGNADEVHRLRVTLRRVRLLLRVGRPLFKPQDLERFRNWAREVAGATGRVRDLDVAIEWLTPKPEARDAIESLALRRDRSWRTARTRLRVLPLDWRARLGKASAGKKAPQRLAARCAKIEDRLRAAARQQIFGYAQLSPLEQHEFRRELRWWRYLRELQLPKRRHAKDELLALLIAAQEAIGNRQNGALTQSAVERLRPSSTVLALLRSLIHERPTRDREIRESLAALAKQLGWQPPAPPASPPGGPSAQRQ